MLHNIHFAKIWPKLHENSARRISAFLISFFDYFYHFYHLPASLKSNPTKYFVILPQDISFVEKILLKMHR